MSLDPHNGESPHKGLFVNGLCKSYGPVQVLADASFEVRPGEVVALLGENGAGKSTISNIIAGSTKPDAGTIIWRGKPYSPANPAEGMSFIYISHRLDEIAQIADRVVVMRDGRIVARHERADIPVRTVVEQMVGRSVERMFPKLSPPGEKTLLEVENLSSPERSFN